MECVSSVSFSLLINGGKSEFFKPSRGLRQGDPLSPYLFMLCQDILSRLLHREFLNGNLSGVKAHICSPALTHVMYADDIVLFSKAKEKEVVLNACLEKYCSWLGQLINRSKSGVTFSKSTSKPKTRSIKRELQMKCLKKDSIYLGAPMFLTRTSTKDFHFLQERLESRLKGWRGKSLSWPGRYTMIKSVAYSLPSCIMSSFEVPFTICDKLENMTRRFWWNPKKENGQYLAWKASYAFLRKMVVLVSEQ